MQRIQFGKPVVWVRQYRCDEQIFQTKADAHLSTKLALAVGCRVALFKLMLSSRWLHRGHPARSCIRASLPEPDLTFPSTLLVLESVRPSSLEG